MHIVLLLLCLLTPSLASAAVGSGAADTFYAVAGCTFNGDGLASNCAASGGASGAFNSFANVIYTVTVGVDDGDTLCISGKFRETLTHTASGTVALPITYKLNCSGLTAGTITGADIEASWTGPDSDGNYTSGSSYTSPTWLLVDGVAARHGATEATLTAGQWYFNGTNVLYRGNPSGHTMEIAVRGVNIDSTGVSNIIVTGGRMEATKIQSAKSAITFKDCTNILITAVTFYAHRGGTNYSGSCTNASVTYTTMTMTGDGIDANLSISAPTNITAAHNRISSLYLNGTDNFVVNVETTHSFHFDKECIANTSAGSGYTIQLNELSDCTDGISLLPVTDVTGYAITSNYIHDVAYGGIVVVCSGSCNITQSSIAGNLIAGCGLSHDTSSGVAYNGGASAPGAKIDVVNNAVVGCSQNYVVSLYSTGDFINNLSIQPTRAASPYHVNFVNWTNVTSASINNNAYYSTGTAWWRKSAVRTTLANWKSDMTPNETAAINTDPLVLSRVSPYNLHTQALSPLRHAGLANTNCIDVRGRVCVVPPDMGAYQASSGDLGAARTTRSQYIFQPVASSTFSSGNANPISESGVWATNQSGGGSFQISAAIANPTDLTQDSGTRYIGTGFNQNQYSRGNLTITGTAGSGSGIGLSICASSSARTMYRFVIDHATSNNASIYRYVAGVGTLLTGGAWTQTFSDADQFTFSNVGETLYVFRASTLVKTIDDTGGGVGCASTRFPGLAFSSTETSASVDNWSGGNFRLAY